MSIWWFCYRCLQDFEGVASKDGKCERCRYAQVAKYLGTSVAPSDSPDGDDSGAL